MRQFFQRIAIGLPWFIRVPFRTYASLIYADVVRIITVCLFTCIKRLIVTILKLELISRFHSLISRVVQLRMVEKSRKSETIENLNSILCFNLLFFLSVQTQRKKYYLAINVDCRYYSVFIFTHRLSFSRKRNALIASFYRT